MVTPKDKDPLIFRIIDYGLHQHSLQFNVGVMIKELKVQTTEVELVIGMIAPSIGVATPNHIIYVTTGAPNIRDAVVTLLPSAIVTYTEYEEIRMARENAQDAKVQSRRAHNIAVLALVASLVVGLIQIVIELIKK